MDQFQVQHVPFTQFQIAEREFPMSLQIADTSVIMGMSDYSLKWYDLETKQQKMDIQNYHNKRIQKLLLVDNTVITCSNDRQIKIFDLKSKQLIHTFRCDSELYSLANSKHILAAGCDSKIEFYDLNMMKWRSKFTSSQCDEISGLHFNPHLSTQLLASSLDGLLVSYDLTKANEEESLYMMVRFEQPLNTCGYWGSLQYCVSTTHQITILDMESDKKLYQFDSRRNDEFNPQYFIDIQSNGEFGYFLGQGQEIIKKNEKQEMRDLLKTNQNDRIALIEQCSGNYILFCENGIVEILHPQQYIKSIAQEAQEMFEEEDIDKKTKKI